MFPRGVTNINESSASNNKSKGKTKVKDGSAKDSKHHTLLSTIILNWVDLESYYIVFSDIPLDDLYIETNITDVIMRIYRKKGSQDRKSVV